jgi:hypothetical protein
VRDAECRFFLADVVYFPWNMVGYRSGSCRILAMEYKNRRQNTSMVCYIPYSDSGMRLCLCFFRHLPWNRSRGLSVIISSRRVVRTRTPKVPQRVDLCPHVTPALAPGAHSLAPPARAGVPRAQVPWSVASPFALSGALAKSKRGEAILHHID